MSNAAELSARRLVRALQIATAGRPGQWRMLHELAIRAGMGGEATIRAAALARREGWLVERMHSVCLTDSGSRLA